MTEAASPWDQLHNHRRFRPQCPDDHVVRFLLDSLGLPENRRGRFLGTGAGALDGAANWPRTRDSRLMGSILRSSVCGMLASEFQRRFRGIF